MPRTDVPVIVPNGPYPVPPIAANSLDFALTVADVSNKNQAAFGSRARLLVLVQNVNAGAQTFTIESAPDGLNREGDVTTYSPATGEFGAFVVARNGWRQADGYLYFEGSHADVKFAIFAI
jgi:hypothetical protein